MNAMTPRQDKRHREIENSLARTLAQRDGCLANLVRYEGRLAGLRRQKLRLDRAMAKAPKVKGIGSVLCNVEAEITAKPEPKPEPAPYRPGASLAAKIDDAINGDNLDIPGFLKRVGSVGDKTPADLADAAAAEQIRKDQAARKRIKAASQAATRKAKAAGDLKRMPLTGKAALAAIRAG
jgi:hypothetical protein